MILGKLLGALFGYLLIGGFSGLLIGAVIGHFIDGIALRGIRARLGAEAGGGIGGGGGSGAGSGTVFGSGAQVDVQAVQQAFFDATFSVLGHVAKSDGRIDEREIALAEALMSRLGLDVERRRAAIERFDEGKASDFSLDAAVERFTTVAPGQMNLYISFLQIQMQVAMADGDYDAAEASVLQEISRLLGMPQIVFRQIEMIARMSASSGAGAYGAGRSGSAGNARPGAGQGGYGRAGAGSGQGASRSGAPTLEQAYAVLGVPLDADRATVKSAWRRQISEHHPDKLVSKGLPKEMMDLANERAQTIHKAWDTIREIKGWR